MMVESMSAMSMRFLRPAVLCTHQSRGRPATAAATISLRWESSPSLCLSPRGERGRSNSPSPCAEDCGFNSLSPWGEGWREGGFSPAGRIKSIASPCPSQRNSSAPFNSRCSAAAVSSSKSSCEGTAVIVIAISMTGLNPVMSLRSSSLWGGSANGMKHGPIAALIASCGEQ